jgi:oligopeptidase B
MNEESNLCGVALLVVPFLDPLCTMSDPSLPLTTLEYDEWGDPHIKEYFESLRRWSPIQNIRSDNMYKYPNVMLIGGLKDSRVLFWEPLKYAAALRHLTAKKGSDHGSPTVLLKINTSVGHSFSGNQQMYFRELSTMYAFFMEQIGATKRIDENIPDLNPE